MRRWMVAGSVVLALGTLVFAGRLWSSTKEQKDRLPRTRVALINLTYVIKNYDKYKTFQNEMKVAFQPYQDEDTKLKAEGEKLVKELKELQDQPADAARKEKIEKKLKRIQQQVEDNNAAAKIALGKRSDEQMVILYKDVADAAQRYVKTHDFDLLLHYNDATTETDLYSPQNIARKLQSGALMPLYASPGMDISKEMVTLLNQSVKKDD